LSQLNLKFSLVASGSLGEYIQDELSSIDDFALNLIFQASLLCRREIVVKDNEVGVKFVFHLDEFFNFPFSNKIFWADGGPELKDFSNDASSCRSG
jgi:hypothetical protein